MRRTVLIVEDEPAIRELLTAILERDGFAVTCAATAADAKLCLSTGSFDVVVTDMRMETADAGYQVLDAARETCPNALRVLLSAFPIPRSESAHAGAHLQFMKGTGVMALLTGLRAALRTPARSQSPLRELAR